jgi:hypothetical protein
MPNTLAHLGFQVPLQRRLGPPVPIRWLLVGAVIPDLPWMMARAVAWLDVPVDWVGLYSYSIIQSSLMFCILFSLAVGTLAQRPTRIVITLSVASLLHLLLDAAETKRANGAQFFVPFDWTVVNWGLFWPESAMTLSLTALGLATILWFRRPLISEPLDLVWPSAARAAALTLFSLAYFFGPFLLIEQPYRHDNHFMRTCLEIEEARDGTLIEADRARVHAVSGTGTSVICSIPLTLEGAFREGANSVSLRGVLQQGQLIILDMHIHGRPISRDLGSYVGLFMILLAWLVPVARDIRRRARSPHDASG